MPKSTTTPEHLLALDIGDKRIGLAIAKVDVNLASPLITLNNDDHLIDELKNIINQYGVKTIIAGLPISLSGQPSNQTKKTQQLISTLKKNLKIQVLTQDEALSSVRAEEELKQRGKIFTKADIDKLAACLILEDYLNSL